MRSIESAEPVSTDGSLWASMGALLLMLLSGACAPQKPVTHPYTGPTLSLPELAIKVNANAQRIETLWAHHNYSATIVDPQTHETHSIQNGDGNLMYRKPFEMRLTGNAIIGQVFELGSSRDEYWATIFLDKVRTQWWGRYIYLGKPCSKPIPIRPDLVMEVLGVADINTDLLRPPAPVMRFNPEQRAYMLIWVMPGQTHWVAQREVWYDLTTFLPTRVLLYDENGRVVLRAALSKHARIDQGDKVQSASDQGASGKENLGAMMATHFELYFPETGSRLSMTLSQLQFQKNGLPREGTIARRPATDLKVIQLDEACGE